MIVEEGPWIVRFDEVVKWASLRLAEPGINFYLWACLDFKPLPIYSRGVGG
jgi:hypothetical protein